MLHHPDKVRPDPAKNETIESLNDHFVELTKAYKALTDEEIRNNYIQYGHPDGKQSFSIGIALPKFIVTEGNGKYVLLVYGMLLGVLLPYIVGKWWYGTQRYTKEKVLIASAGNIFREYKDDIPEGGIVSALSSGDEYKLVLKGNKAENGLATVEKKILDEGENTRFASGLTLSDKERLGQLEDSGRRKALALLWAYLGRVELDDSTLNDGKIIIVPNCAFSLTKQYNRKIRSCANCSHLERLIFSDCLGIWEFETYYRILPRCSKPYSSYTPRIISSSPATTFHTQDRRGC